MIFAEVPLKSLEREIELLQKVDGPHGHTFASGAIAALEWIRSSNARPPSQHMMVSHVNNRPG